MALPVLSVIRPSALSTHLNGQLPEEILRTTSTRNLRLLEKPSYAWEALKAELGQLGILLDSTGMYRSYKLQQTLFLDRYQVEPIPNRPYKWWNGIKYYQKAGVAQAATPGTSNHGWGLAVDIAEQLDADPEQEGISSRALTYLVGGIAEQFGWSWELQSEPWHLRYVAGDDLPVAVVEWMHSTAPPTPDPPLPPVIPTPPEVYLINMPVCDKTKADKNATFTLQGLLNLRAGFSIAVDGDFGTQTDQALRKYQAVMGLTVDGVAGPKTWNRIGH